MLVSQSEFARIARVSKQAIAKQIKAGNIPINSEKKIDMDYPTVKKYLSDHKKREDKKKREAGKKKKVIDPGPPDEKNKKSDNKKEVDAFLNEDIYNPETEIDIESFQKAINLTNLKTLSEIRLKEADRRKKVLDEKIKRGDYINRNTQARMIFAYLDNLNRRLLNFPLQFIDRIIALIDSDSKNARGKIIELWTEETAKLLKSTKRECKKNFEKNLFKEDE